jgi:hypothetical protein
MAFVILLIIVPAIAYFLWPSDEARIKKLIREGAAAIEAKKAEEVMKKVALHYQDDHGLSYLLLKQGMQRLFQQMEKIQVEYEVKAVAVGGQKATADIDVRVIATARNDTGYIVGDAGKAQALRFRLEKERAAWLVVSTEGMKELMWGQ